MPTPSASPNRWRPPETVAAAHDARARGARLDIPGGERVPARRSQIGTDPAAHGDLPAEIERYLARGIDGFFTDFPGDRRRVRDACGRPVRGKRPRRARLTFPPSTPSTSRSPTPACRQTGRTAGSCCRACPATAGNCRNSSPATNCGIFLGVDLARIFHVAERHGGGSWISSLCGGSAPRDGRAARPAAVAAPSARAFRTSRRDSGGHRSVRFRHAPNMQKNPGGVTPGDSPPPRSESPGQRAFCYALRFWICRAQSLLAHSPGTGRVLRGADLHFLQRRDSAANRPCNSCLGTRPSTSSPSTRLTGLAAAAFPRRNLFVLRRSAVGIRRIHRVRAGTRRSCIATEISGIGWRTPSRSLPALAPMILVWWRRVATSGQKNIDM